MRRSLGQYNSPSLRHALTLVEVLVVIAIIAFLVALLIPNLKSARQSAQRAMCLANLRQIGVAIHAYSLDNRGSIPFGPKAPPMSSAADFYPSTGAPTSLLSIKTGAPVGLGLLLRNYLTAQRRVLFCPGSDQPDSADEQLAKVGFSQAQGSYYYRHGSVTLMYDPPGSALPRSEYTKLAQLGQNRDGKKIRALVIDSMFMPPADFASFGITTRTHHQQRFANVLYADGHSDSRPNTDRRFTVTLNSYSELMNAFSNILRVLETADADK